MSLSLFPDAIGPGIGLFLLLASTLTSMVTAALGAGGGVLLLVLMASWMPPAAIIPVHGLGGPSEIDLRFLVNFTGLSRKST